MAIAALAELQALKRPRIRGHGLAAPVLAEIMMMPERDIVEPRRFQFALPDRIVPRAPRPVRALAYRTVRQRDVKARFRAAMEQGRILLSQGAAGKAVEKNLLSVEILPERFPIVEKDICAGELLGLVHGSRITVAVMRAGNEDDGYSALCRSYKSDLHPAHQVARRIERIEQVAGDNNRMHILLRGHRQRARQGRFQVLRPLLGLVAQI